MPATFDALTTKAGSLRVRLVRMTPAAMALYGKARPWRACCERLNARREVVWSEAGEWSENPGAALYALACSLPGSRRAAMRAVMAVRGDLAAFLYPVRP